MITLQILFTLWFIIFMIYIAWIISDQNKEREEIQKQRMEIMEELEKKRDALISKKELPQQDTPEQKPMSKYKSPYLEEYKWYYIAKNVITKGFINDDWTVFSNFLWKYDILKNKPNKKLFLIKSIYSGLYYNDIWYWGILYISKKYEYSSKNLSDCKARIDIKDKSEQPEK